ncbi:MAG: hypothetical protein F4X34_00260 [Chloroflexi bacterium]|nr:hypothetical protein [Chloroflexota bacterium]
MTEQNTTNERLARVEATVEALVREVSDLRSAERTHFFWLLGILVGVIAPTMLGLLVTLIVLIMSLQ